MKINFYTIFRNKFMTLVTAFVVPVAIYSASSWAQAETVDINKADEVTLATNLSGVGESLAAAIVGERTANGPFLSADDLERVRGIGEAIVDRNRAKIVVGTDSARPRGDDPEPASVSSADDQKNAVNQ